MATTIDLIAGLSGWSTGARSAGVEVLWAANHWPAGVEWHSANHPGTKQAFAELMAWAEIDEHGEALPLKISHLDGLGPNRAVPLLEVPRHEITLSPSVARRLEVAYQCEA
jgi:site-specific DNA-cytosine methylase